jgi:hypothetical protein
MARIVKITFTSATIIIVHCSGRRPSPPTVGVTSPSPSETMPFGFNKRGQSTVRYFFSADATSCEVAFYIAAVVLVSVYGAIAVLSPVITPACDMPVSTITYGNKDHVNDPCKFTRYVALGGLNMWECIMCSRIFYSLVLGSLIGWERRRADRAAGIRRRPDGMGRESRERRDPEWRGLLGRGVDLEGDGLEKRQLRARGAQPRPLADCPALPRSSDRVRARVRATCASRRGLNARLALPALPAQVHGLTTATSVWLSAAVGILVGGGLFAPAIFSTLSSIIYLRFAPRYALSARALRRAWPPGLLATRVDAGRALTRAAPLARSPAAARQGRARSSARARRRRGGAAARQCRVARLPESAYRAYRGRAQAADALRARAQGEHTRLNAGPGGVARLQARTLALGVQPFGCAARCGHGPHSK